MLDIKSTLKNYNFFKDKNISNSKIFRYIELKNILKNYRDILNIELVGYSIEKKKILKIKWGVGRKKIFIISQMHGNETTGTKAVFDLFSFLKKRENIKIADIFFRNLTIFFIPMLNPDGSEYFQRRNSINIDLNRDTISLQSPEIKILIKEIKKHKPNIIFNLHDQRTIYNVGKKKFNPAILSFLSPSISNKKTDINYAKKISMNLIYNIYKNIKSILPYNIGSIGRYSSEYIPTAIGDYLQIHGYPCILIESGNYPGDIKKTIVRKYSFLSILFGVFSIYKENIFIKKNYMNYFYIKKNRKILLDRIYRKVKIKKNNSKFFVDIGLMYIEKFNFLNEKIEYYFRIVDIGDLSMFFSYEEIISVGKEYHGNNGETFPKIGDIKNFKIC